MKKFFQKNKGIILILIGLILIYTLLTDVFGVLDSFLFPGLSIVFPAFIEYLPELIDGLFSSLLLLLPAFFSALFLAIFFGVIIGLKPILRRNITPYINAFSAIPATLLTPFAIHIFSTFRQASMFIIFIGSFWPILGTTISAVMTIDKRYLDNADTLELSKLKKTVKIILPAASPTILAGCTIALKFSFVLLTVAEMFGATSGMGFFIQYYSDFARFDLVLVGFLFMAIVLVTIMYLFDLVKRRILHWTLNN